MGRRKSWKNKDSRAGGWGSEGSEGEEKHQKAGLLKVVVRFEGEGGVKTFDLLKLPKNIVVQVGQVKYVKVIGDGNLLIGGNTK